MKCVANYEIKSECSVLDDGRVLKIQHPKGIYRARIQNLPRSVYTTPFLLSLHLSFDAPTLEDSKDKADELLADCLNMLAFATGSSVRRHRIRQIVDATPEASGMRSMLFWGDSIEYEDPEPLLDEGVSRSIERLLEFEMPSAIRRALRWYRLGINETTPDDQFMNFWFAMELVAEYKKSPEKVPSKCPTCLSPLYCESCKTHPVHRPYPKQAIQALLKSVEEGADGETFERLDKARNSLMHGSTLEEIEASLPQPHEQIVDVLGHLLWKALVMQFPREMFDGTLNMFCPTTYVHRTLHAVAHIQTVVPVNADGDFDLSFTGLKAQVVMSGPPQSARPTIITISPEQYERITPLAFRKSDHQEMCRRIYQDVREHTGKLVTRVLATDMSLIKGALDRHETGDWQDLFREIMENQSIDSMGI